PAQRFSSYDDLVAELERAWRALALEDATSDSETRRRRWPSALSRFTRRSFEALSGVLRWHRRLPLLIRVALPPVMAAGILLVMVSEKGGFTRLYGPRDFVRYRTQQRLVGSRPVE